MSTTDTQAPRRRPGPHAPIPGAAPPADAAPQPAPAASGAPPKDDPRARAARRAAELRQHQGVADEGTDKFYFDPAIIPDGWSYEWRMFTVLGKEDPSYQVNLAQKGWEAVPRSRHPEMMPAGWQGETIVRDGQMLMERPKEITEEAKVRDRQAAREQMRAKEEQLGVATGPFERHNKGNPLVSVNKSRESVIPIPDK